MKKNKIFEEYFSKNSQFYENFMKKNIEYLVNVEFDQLLREQAKNYNLNSVRGIQQALWDFKFAHNPKNKTEDVWVDGKIGSEYRQSVRNFQVSAKKAGKYNKEIDAKFGSGSRGAMKALISGEWSSGGVAQAPEPGYQAQAEPVDQEVDPSSHEKFMSDRFSLEKVKSMDKELYDAIKLTENMDLRQSRLFFDGKFLHWFIAGEHIIKFPASSGHFEDSSLAYGKPGFKKEAQKAAIDLYKILRKVKPDDTSGAKQNVVQALKDMAEKQGKEVDYILLEIRAGIVVEEWEAMKEIELEYASLYREIENAMNQGDVREKMNPEELKAMNAVSEKYRIASRKLMKSFMDTIDDIFANFQTSDDERRKQQRKSGQGPIPEGPYSIKHRLHDLSNDLQVDFYTFIADGAALIDDPTGKLSNEIGGLMDADKGEEFDYAAVHSFGDEADANKKMGDNMYNWAWGNFRVRISQGNKFAKEVFKRNRRTYGRSGFYIHGGDFRGSGGCIDLQDQVDRFAKFWVLTGLTKIMGPVRKALMKDMDTEAKLSMVGARAKADFSIPLFVKYSDEIKNKLMKNDAVAANDSEIVFNKSGAS